MPREACKVTRVWYTRGMHPLTAWRARQRPEVSRGTLAKLLDDLRPSVGKAKDNHRRAVWRIETYAVVPSYELARAIERATHMGVRVDDLINDTVRDQVRARKPKEAA